MIRKKSIVQNEVDENWMQIAIKKTCSLDSKISVHV